MEKAKKIIWILCLSMIFSSAFSQGTRVLNFATYLGGPGNNEPIEVGLTASDKIVVAGNFTTIQQPAKHINLLQGADSSAGKILLINQNTGNVETILHLGARIYDFTMPPNSSNVAFVAGSFGVALINLSNLSILWDTLIVNPLIKLSISNDQECAILSSTNIYHLRGSDGRLMHTGPKPYDVANDIAIIGNRIFVTGFNLVDNIGGKYCSNRPGPPSQTLQVAYLDSYVFTTSSYFMTLDTHTWGFKSEEMNCDIAITRGLKLSVGQNGYLYFLGETYHAENIFKYNGKTNYVLNGNLYPPTTNVAYDPYNSLDNTGSATLISYVARITPTTGQVLNGQFIMSRNDTLNESYDVRNGSILADQVGNVHIGGMAGNAIQNRNTITIAGVKVSPYSGGDPALLITNSSFVRNSWEVFTGENGKGTILGLALSQDKFVALGRLEKGNCITSSYDSIKSPFNPSDSDGRTDAFLYVWNIPAITSTYPSELTQSLKVINNSLDLQAVPEIESLEISNLQGKIIEFKSGVLPSNFSLNNYPTGVYILRISAYNQVFINKIFIE